MIGIEEKKYVVCTVGRLYAARWSVIDVNGLSQVEEDLRRFMGRSREPVVYASVTDSLTSPPQEDAKRRMVKMAEELVPVLRGFYVVVTASGFKASLHRGALAGMMLLSKLRGKVHVVSGLEEVIAAEGLAGLGVDPAMARATLAREGVLQRDEVNE